MRKPIPIFLLLGLFGMLGAQAQEAASKLELYGGYYYVRFNINADLAGVPPSQTFNANGGGSQLEYNASKWLGVVGESGRLCRDQ